INTLNRCELCHATFSWKTDNIDHTQTVGSCESCHLKDISGTHRPRPAAASCDICHITNTWNTILSHSSFTLECAECHIKTGLHISTTELCGRCHVTSDWKNIPAKPDHNEILGTCLNCHLSDFDTVKHTFSVRECTGSGCHNPTDNMWRDAD
ncbi:MAG: hypothetical protein OEX07_06100, partial [Gammaproteobacteria bacterium]|nr:hypothetical protein [Gammaproteobacteria bacterium]